MGCKVDGPWETFVGRVGISQRLSQNLFREFQPTKQPFAETMHKPLRPPPTHHPPEAQT